MLRRAEPEERHRLSLVGAAVVGVPAWLIGWLLLNNLQGPLPAASPRPVAPVLVGLVAAAAGYAVAHALLGLSRAAALISLAAYAVAGLVLFPNAIDTHESFVDQPNPRQQCHGWEFSHYPPGVLDEASTRYCVGLESPLPPG